MQKQREWKILKDLKLSYPNCEKGIELLCQSTIFIKGTRYRDVILQLSKSHYKLTSIFLAEVTHHQVKVNDKNWRKRFSKLYSPDKALKTSDKQKKKDNLKHLIRKENQGNQKGEEDDTIDESSSSVVEEGSEEGSEEDEVVIEDEVEDEQSDDFVL